MLTIWPVVLGLFLLGAMMAALLVLRTADVRAQGPDQANVVIQMDDGTNRVRSVNFSGPISGLVALKLTGLDIVESNGAVCSIDGLGCPAENCFCACESLTDCKFWNYLFWNGNAWESYNDGAGISSINDGAVEGWAWGPPLPTTPVSAPAALAASAALGWLGDQQDITDGGYGDLGDSVEVLMAVAANQLNPTDWTRADSPSLINYVLKSDTAGFVNNDPAAFGKLAVALSAADACWPDGTDKMPATTGNPGEYSTLSGPQAWAMLGKVALSQTLPAQAAQILKNQINNDGGWSWLGSSSDADGTALAIQALIAAGQPVTATEVLSGLIYLKSLQTNDGGFANTAPEVDGNSNSTAYAVQALIAAGQDPISAAWTVSGNNPISFLTELQKEDGRIPWKASKDGDIERATRQSIPALLNTAFPIKVANLETCSAAITVEKRSNPVLAAAGQTVTYNYQVTNTGNVEVDLTAVDDKLGTVTFAAPTLAAGRTTTGTLEYVVTSTDTASSLLTNTVTVTATPPISAAVTDSATLAVVTAVPAEIRHLAPFACDDPPSCGDVEAQSSGASVVVKNGLQSIQFTDLKFGNASGSFDLAQIKSLVMVTPNIIPGLKTTVPITPSAGLTHKLILIGDNINDDAPLEILVLTGTTIKPSPGNGLLRITHLATMGADRDATAVDIDLQNSIGSVAPFPQSGVRYKTGIGYIQIPSGVYTVSITPLNGGDPKSRVIEINSGDVGDIFVAGNDTNQAVTVQAVGVKQVGDTSNVYMPVIFKN